MSGIAAAGSGAEGSKVSVRRGRGEAGTISLKIYNFCNFKTRQVQGFRTLQDLIPKVIDLEAVDFKVFDFNVLDF